MKYKYTVAELTQMSKCRWLTNRERRVFEMYYRKGYTIEYIAAALSISRRTVDNDLRQIRTKCLKLPL